MWRPSLAALLGACVAGCAASPPPHPATAARGFVPVSRFDGSYQGQATLVSARNATCPRARYGVLEVGDAQLTYAYTPSVIFTTRVATDGRLHQQIGQTVLDGRIAGDHLAMSITSPECTTRYDMRFVWNHSSTQPLSMPPPGR